MTKITKAKGSPCKLVHFAFPNVTQGQIYEYFKSSNKIQTEQLLLQLIIVYINCVFMSNQNSISLFLIKYE